jgi:hypothetical protein
MCGALRGTSVRVQPGCGAVHAPHTRTLTARTHLAHPHTHNHARDCPPFQTSRHSHTHTHTHPLSNRTLPALTPPLSQQHQAAQELQKSGAAAFVLDDMDFGRRYALEKEIRAAGACACVC